MQENADNYMDASDKDQATMKESKMGGITDLLLQDIQTGTLPAGTWLNQSDLGQRNGCKRPEVRQALDRLTQSRVVQHLTNRGYRVYEVDERRSQEITDIRVVLETSVANKMIDNATPAEIVKLRRDWLALADKRHLDEVLVRIKRRLRWLWRAVDANGVFLDILAQSRRNKAATRRFLLKHLKRWIAPRVMAADILRS